MKKMPCLFVREFKDDRTFSLTSKLSPGCEWILDEGVEVSIKWDGTACLVQGGVLYKRYDAKRNPKTGEFRQPPEGAIECSPPDEETGHWPHWVPVDVSNPQDVHHAVWAPRAPKLPDGTYELCGPGINGNPQNFDQLTLLQHGRHKVYIDFKQDLMDAIADRLTSLPHYEGFVFKHPDGRMCKIRQNDFGFEWPRPVETNQQRLERLSHDSTKARAEVPERRRRCVSHPVAKKDEKA